MFINERKEKTMAKTKLNPMTDKPTNKLQVSKEFMLGYLVNKSMEEQDWYIDLFDKNTKDGKTEWKAVREEFIAKYFDYLNEKKKVQSYRDDMLKAFNRK